MNSINCLAFPQKQRGFLSLMAVIIILIFAILSAGLSYMFTSKITSTNYINGHTRAFAAAEGNREKKLQELNVASINGRALCTDSSNISLGGAGSSLSSQAFSSTTASLANNPDHHISESDTSIILNNSSNLAPTGRIYIDKEAIDYQHNDGNTTLSHLTRGTAGTTAATHIDGTIVSQYQCYFTSYGHSPTSGTSLGQSYIAMANQMETAIAVGDNQIPLRWNPPNSENNWQIMNGSSVQLNAIDMLNPHQGWAVGNNGLIYQLYAGSWAAVASPNSQNLNGVSSVSAQEAWAVGNINSSDINMIKWNGHAWSTAPNIPSAIDANLYAIQTIDTDNDGMANIGFAVGSTVTVNNGGQCNVWQSSCNSGPQPNSDCKLFVTQSGGNNCYTPRSDLNFGQSLWCAVSYSGCVNFNNLYRCRHYINNCVDIIPGGSSTLGGNTLGEGIILQYDGNTWADSTINGNSSSIAQLNDVSITTNNISMDAYAVGEDSSGNGVVVHWNTNSWDKLPSPSPSQIMRSISMIDSDNNGIADFGFMVGDGGQAYIYQCNPTCGWTLRSIGSNDLFAVKTLTKTNAWVVGANGTSYHWDGSTWSLISTGSSNPLRGISASGTLSGGASSSGWNEVLN